VISAGLIVWVVWRRTFDGPWTTVVSAKHKFKIDMPGNPESKQENLAFGAIDVWEAFEPGKSGGMLKVYVRAAPIADEMVTKEALDAMRDAAIEGMKCRFVRDKERQYANHYVGRDVEVEVLKNGDKGRCFFLVANGTYYSFMAFAHPSSPFWKKVDRSFDSFELIP